MLLLLIACTGGSPADSTDSALGETGALDSGASGETGDTAPEPPPFPDLQLGVPAFTTATDPGWSDRVSAAAATHGWIVVDINEGPGDGKDSGWASTIAAARAAGVPVVGYVATAGGVRDAGDVSRDIGRYVAWYAMDGVYFDASDAADCDAAAAAYTVHAGVADQKDPERDAFVVIGVRDGGCASLFAAADVFVSAGTGAALLAAPDVEWHAAFPSTQFALWASDVAAADVLGLMQFATDHHYGVVYATDQADETPYDTLPTYWAAEVSAITR